MITRFLSQRARALTSAILALAACANAGCLVADDFTDQVLPILRDKCFDCHSHEAGEASGGLMLDSLNAIKAGGARGNALGDQPSNSALLEAVEFENDDLQMPPDGRLSDQEIAALKTWVRQGAPVPESFVGPEISAATVEFASHWAYLPVSRPQTNGKRHRVDEIIAERMPVQLRRSPPAEPAVLLRRLYYDLLGLPPSAAQVRQQLPSLDESPGYATVVDELLRSDHFGERWARHWMDVARYADNKGYLFQENREYEKAFQYRDWLIGAFNSDMPYDQFVRMQLAADLVENPQDDDIPALGFLTLGRRFLNNKHDIIDDRIDVAMRGVMGLTVACARCHDHKYDPVTQADYYSLYGIFDSSEEPGGGSWPHRLADKEKPRDAAVLLRGVPGNRGPRVPRQFIRFLTPDAEKFSQGSGRLELADNMVSPDNPLTARVIANRVWMHLAGKSLVDSPSDFGVRCPQPAQLKLLDHLAGHLIDSGWSIKSLIRHIVTSGTYQQSSRRRAGGDEQDPENQLYWRWNRKRLDFESMRDTLLSVSGQLNPTILGPSEKIESAPYSFRRTLYAYIDRQNLPNLFRTFDAASPDTHTPMRSQTSVPQQGLYMLNSGFVAQQAVALAARSGKNSLTTDERIAFVFQAVLNRLPADSELMSAREFVAAVDSELPQVVAERWIPGYAAYDADKQTLGVFQRLPYYTGDAWQGGPELPNSKIGWCILNQAGGHPGNDLQHAVVRRWIAPASGRVIIGGKLNHKSDNGDGVRASVIHHQEASALQLGQWVVAKSSRTTQVKAFEVQAGDAVDFVTDCRSGPSHDGFEWKVNLRYQGQPDSRVRSDQQFPGPPPLELDAWAQLCQILLASNEVAFVD